MAMLALLALQSAWRAWRDGPAQAPDAASQVPAAHW